MLLLAAPLLRLPSASDVRQALGVAGLPRACRCINIAFSVVLMKILSSHERILSSYETIPSDYEFDCKTKCTIDLFAPNPVTTSSPGRASAGLMQVFRYGKKSSLLPVAIIAVPTRPTRGGGAALGEVPPCSESSLRLDRSGILRFAALWLFFLRVVCTRNGIITCRRA